MMKLLILAALAAGTCLAGTTPVMVSLVTPVQAPSADFDVTGLRLDLIYGQAHNVTGLDLGIVNYAQTMEKGVQIGLVNIISRNGWMPVFPFVNGSF